MRQLPEFDGQNIAQMLLGLEETLDLLRAAGHHKGGADKKNAERAKRYERLNAIRSFLLWCIANSETIMDTKKRLDP